MNYSITAVISRETKNMCDERDKPRFRDTGKCLERLGALLQAHFNKLGLFADRNSKCCFRRFWNIDSVVRYLKTMFKVERLCIFGSKMQSG